MFHTEICLWFIVISCSIQFWLPTDNDSQIHDQIVSARGRVFFSIKTCCSIASAGRASLHKVPKR